MCAMERFRIGQGYDSHRFDANRPLVLGGVVIPDTPGLKAHSDGDALIHAIIDALLGAAALGDIGQHFPDSDPAFRGVDSAQLLAKTMAKIHAAGWSVGNLDATVICERPKLRPHIDEMRARLASLLGCRQEDVSLKGKTNEGMDATGVGEGLAVHCVVLLTARA